MLLGGAGGVRGALGRLAPSGRSPASNADLQFAFENSGARGRWLGVRPQPGEAGGIRRVSSRVQAVPDRKSTSRDINLASLDVNLASDT